MKKNLISIVFVILLISSASAQKWEMLDFPSEETITGISFLNPNTFYMTTNNGNIVRTINKGVDWQAVTPLKGVALEDIQFLDDKVGFVCGERGTVLRTTDGGVSWEVINPSDSTPHFFDIVMSDIATGFAIGLRSGENSPYEGVLYRTTTGGNEWDRYEPGGFGYNEAVLEDKSLYLLSFGKLNITKDLGQTWESITTHEGNPGRTISKQGKTIVIAGIKGLILYSSDEGKTFHKISQQFEDINFISVEMISEKVGYVGGTDGGIYSTTDGGKTWTAEAIPRSFTVLDLASSGNQIYAVGSDGTIIRKGLIEYKSIKKNSPK